MNSDIIAVIMYFSLGLFAGYIISYFKQKGKNRALVEDLNRLTDEKEKISSKYELDISKRKYKYEDKRIQYFKYFNLLDELNAHGNEEAQKAFIPAINKFNKSFLSANGDKNIELEATTTFSESINALMFKANESIVKLKQETNTLKLIAGKNVLNVLADLENLFEVSLEKSSEMMKDFASNLVYGKHDVIEKQKEEIEKIGGNILILKEKLIQEVRNELDEI